MKFAEALPSTHPGRSGPVLDEEGRPLHDTADVGAEGRLPLPQPSHHLNSPDGRRLWEMEGNLSEYLGDGSEDGIVAQSGAEKGVRPLEKRAQEYLKQEMFRVDCK